LKKERESKGLPAIPWPDMTLSSSREFGAPKNRRLDRLELRGFDGDIGDTGESGSLYCGGSGPIGGSTCSTTASLALSPKAAQPLVFGGSSFWLFFVECLFEDEEDEDEEEEDEEEEDDEDDEESSESGSSAPMATY
jgi:hypothetical protein